MARSIGTVLAAAGLLVAISARAGGGTCVTGCQEKMNLCASQCAEKSGNELEHCQLGCSKLLFVKCVEQCSETGLVILNDYQIVVPTEESSEPADSAEQEPPAREQAEDRQEANRE